MPHAETRDTSGMPTAAGSGLLLKRSNEQEVSPFPTWIPIINVPSSSNPTVVPCSVQCSDHLMVSLKCPRSVQDVFLLKVPLILYYRNFCVKSVDTRFISCPMSGNTQLKKLTSVESVRDLTSVIRFTPLPSNLAFR